MDASSLAIGLIILGLFVGIPIFFVQRNSKKKIYRQELSNVAQQTGNSITEYSIHGKVVIGIDCKNHVLFFTNKNHDDDFLQLHLNDILSCKSASVVNRHDGHNAVEKRSIILTFKEKKKAEAELVFFDLLKDGISHDGNKELANKWLKIIEREIACSNKNQAL